MTDLSQVDTADQGVYDVIVIGGGPAGTTAATTLAQAGYAVLLLERHLFPRFHIGESLLPYMTRLLEQLKLLERIDTGDFVVKRGAEFTGVSGDFRRVDFTAQGPSRAHSAFQVERAHFDEVLLNFARETGVTVLQEAQVIQPLFEEGTITGVIYTQQGQQHVQRARYVIDASGRVGKVATYLKLRKPNQRLKMVGMYRHFAQLDERNNPGYYGDIQIGNHEEGWIWAIPTRDDIISIGAVMPAATAKGSSSEEVFASHIQRIPRIQKRLAGTVPQGEVRTESDYCYYSDTVAGSGYFLVGDAGCFVDPVFSGGVYLAMTTGRKAAETIVSILQEHLSPEQAAREYERFYKTGYDCYFREVYSFYESNFHFGRQLASLPIQIEGKWIARVLSGDFWSRENPLTSYLRTVKKWDTFAPFEVAYGCPIYPELERQEASTR